MLTVIICSISKQRSEETCRNIRETAGVECEFLVFDNTEKKLPIAKVYNLCAQKARYDNLLFVHEDVLFFSYGWGKTVCRKLNEEENCGCLGFAGSQIRMNTYYACFTNSKFDQVNYIQGYRNSLFAYCFKPDVTEAFTPAVCLDGMAIFVSRNNWAEHPFDETHLKGFHCYDIDFSLQLHVAGKVNYVVTDPNIIAAHLSAGNYNVKWFIDTVNLQNNKWQTLTPALIQGIDIDKEELSRLEKQALEGLINNSLMNETDSKELDSVIEHYEKKYGRAEKAKRIHNRHKARKLQKREEFINLKHVVKANRNFSAVRKVISESKFPASKKLKLWYKYFHYNLFGINRKRFNLYNDVNEVLDYIHSIRPNLELFRPKS